MEQAPPRVAVDDLSVLLPDWRTHLRARNVAPRTIASYLEVDRNLLAWLTEAGMPTTASGVRREHVEAFLAALGDRVSPATVAKHYRSLQQLFRWLVDDGEVPDSPMARMRPPAVPEQPAMSGATAHNANSRFRSKIPSGTMNSVPTRKAHLDPKQLSDHHFAARPWPSASMAAETADYH